MMPTKVAPSQKAGRNSGSVPIRIPSGVADPSGKTGYLANANEGVSALDLRTGKVVWQAGGPITPILVSGQKLIVWRPATNRHNALRINTLDTRTGRSAWSSALIVLPPSVAVETEGIERSSFVATGRTQKDQLLLVWGASTSSIDGAARPVQISGVVSVDLQTGFVKNLPESKAPMPPTGWIEKAVVGPRVFYLVGAGDPARDEADDVKPRGLKAVDRKSGKTLWKVRLPLP